MARSARPCYWKDRGWWCVTIAQNASGGFDVIGTHTYNFDGSFAVVVVINDVGGSTATVESGAITDPSRHLFV